MKAKQVSTTDLQENMRIIKKYPNRRLYDVRTSSYITLADVKNLVLKHDNFQVINAKTGEEITRSILLQIILEEESGGMPMFTAQLLSQMIRFYGNAMQGMMGKYLESNVKAFEEFQITMQEQANALYGENSTVNPDLYSHFLSYQGPAVQSMMSAYLEQSRVMLREMQNTVRQQAQTMMGEMSLPMFQPFTKKKAPYETK